MSATPSAARAVASSLQFDPADSWRPSEAVEPVGCTLADLVSDLPIRHRAALHRDEDGWPSDELAGEDWDPQRFHFDSGFAPEEFNPRHLTSVGVHREVRVRRPERSAWQRRLRPIWLLARGRLQLLRSDWSAGSSELVLQGHSIEGRRGDRAPAGLGRVAYFESLMRGVGR